MPSDAKVPDPLPRGLTVPALAVVLLVALAGGWGVGMFLLGRASAPASAPADSAATAALAWFNRLDQGIVQGDLDDAREQVRTASADEPLVRTALELRRVRIAALTAERAAAAAAAAPEAVLQRLQAALRPLDPRLLAPPAPVAAPADVPVGVAAVPAGVAAAPVAMPPAPAPLAEERLGDQPFIPLARIVHPTIAGRAYALHPARGLVRSDDGGTTWRSGLEPLTRLHGTRLLFTGGAQPLLLIVGDPLWLFADGPDRFFP